MKAFLDPPCRAAALPRGALDLPSQEGFSFLELLVVITIILILLALEVPNLFRARAAAGDAAAAASLRTIQAAEVTYSLTYSRGFSPDLTSLGTHPGQAASPAAAGLIDELLASGSKNGFTYTYIPGPVENGQINDYTLIAVPSEPCATGLSYYTASPYSPPSTLSPESGGSGSLSSLLGTEIGGVAGCGGGP